jgi:chaperone BCS1
MHDFFKNIVTGQNQFASGGLLLMIIGGVSVYLRAIPQNVWYWFVRQTTMMITVTDDDAAFAWVKEWFLEQKFLTNSMFGSRYDCTQREDCDGPGAGDALVLVWG